MERVRRKVLTANGTIFIDGSAQIQNGAVNTYTGSATIYISGHAPDQELEHVPGGLAAEPAPTSGWDPSQRMLVFVANGNGSGSTSPQNQVASGDSVQLVSANAQGALYATERHRARDTTSNSTGHSTERA